MSKPLYNKLPESSSFSQMYTAALCLRKYFLSYVVGLKEPPRTNLARGIGMHLGYRRSVLPSVTA